MTLAERMKGAAAAALAAATATTGDDSDEEDGSHASRASDGNVPAISQEGDDWATITTGTAHGTTTPAPTAGGGVAPAALATSTQTVASPDAAQMTARAISFLDQMGRQHTATTTPSTGGVVPTPNTVGAPPPPAGQAQQPSTPQRQPVAPMVGYRAVAQRMGERINQPAYVTSELERQASVGVDPRDRWKQFRDDSIAFSGLRIFGFMREGANTIKLVSSMATYSDFGGAPEINGKTIGFMGDRRVAGGLLGTPSLLLSHHKLPGNGNKWGEIRIRRR